MYKNFEQERQDFFNEFRTKSTEELEREQENLQEYIKEVTDAQDYSKPLKNESYLRAVGHSDPYKVETILNNQRASLLEQAKDLPEDKKRLSHINEYLKSEQKKRDNEISLGRSL